MIDERFLPSLYEHHADAIAACALDGTILSVNGALERMTGFAAAELFGRNAQMLAVESELPKIRSALLDASHGVVRDLETVFIDRLGRRIDVGFDAIPIVIEDTVAGFFVVARDVTRLKTAIAALREQDDRIRSLYMIAATQNKSPDEQIEELLRTGCRLLGMETGFVTELGAGVLRVVHVYSATKAPARHAQAALEHAFSRHILESEIPIAVDSLGESAWEAIDAQDLMAWSAALGTRVRVGRTNYGTLEFRDTNARRVPFSETDRDLIALMSAFVATEVQRERTEQQLDQLAYYDPLTKLPNRALFSDRLSHAVTAAKRSAKPLAVLFLDLDRFKEINDELGHDAGDLLLRVVAERLRGTVRASDTVARLGGDEFTVLLPEIRGADDAVETASKILTALAPPVRLGEGQRHITTSIGISLYPQDGHSVALLMKHADMAMYGAKAKGRNRYALFEPAMAAAARG